MIQTDANQYTYEYANEQLKRQVIHKKGAKYVVIATHIQIQCQILLKVTFC